MLLQPPQLAKSCKEHKTNKLHTSSIVTVACCAFVHGLKKSNNGALFSMTRSYKQLSDVDCTSSSVVVLSSSRFWTCLRAQLRQLSFSEAIRRALLERDEVFMVAGVRDVVFFMHGILDTSMGWVANGTGSHAFAAFDQGMDVWLGSSRSNPPREHKGDATHDLLTRDEGLQYLYCWPFAMKGMWSLNIDSVAAT